jgi:hypothetical protein
VQRAAAAKALLHQRGVTCCRATRRNQTYSEHMQQTPGGATVCEGVGTGGKIGGWLMSVEAARRLGPLQLKACVRLRKQNKQVNTLADTACQQPMQSPKCQGEPRAQPFSCC